MRKLQDYLLKKTLQVKNTLPTKMPEEIEQLKRRIEGLEAKLDILFYSDRYVFSRDIQMMDGRNIQLATGTGTRIGTAISQLLGFYNVTPVDQPAAVTDPSGGATIDAEARTAIIATIDRLQELGLIA